MIIALIAIVSLVALAQFAVFYWRATISVAAASPVSERLRKAAGIESETLRATDFKSLLPLVDICPALKADSAGIRGVRCYYSAMSLISQLLGPAMAGWAVAEMATCTRYLAARLDQRIAENAALWNNNAA